MPLFMILSGYLFYYTSSRYEFKKLIATRFSKILIPIVTCTLLENTIEIIQNLNVDNTLSISYLVKHFINSIIYNLWFLWAIFFCSIIIICVSKFLKDSIAVYSIIMICMLLTPDVYNFYLYKYMFPYFLGAYLYNKYGISKRISNLSFVTKSVSFSIIVLIFLVFLSFFNYDSYIYTSKISLVGKNIMKQLGIDVYRWVIGFLGSIFTIGIIILLDKVNKYSFAFSMKRGIGLIGQNSLGVYIISTLFININLLFPLTEKFKFNVLSLFIESILVLIVCYIITEVIKRSSLANRLLFGGR